MQDCEMLEDNPKGELARFYEAEIDELQGRIINLEAKNQEYLNLFCGGNQTDIAMLQSLDLRYEGLDTSQEAIALLEESLSDLAAKNNQIEYMKVELQKW